MKKIIMTSIIVIIFIFKISIVSADENLKIDTGSLKNSNNDAYTSITDIYKINLFTEKIINQNKKLETQEEDNIKEINNSIFIDIKSTNDSNKEEFEKQVESYNLFVKPKAEIKMQYIEDKHNIEFISIAIIIILCILTAMITRKYYKYRRKKEEDTSEYNNYVRF